MDLVAIVRYWNNADEHPARRQERRHHDMQNPTAELGAVGPAAGRSGPDQPTSAQPAEANPAPAQLPAGSRELSVDLSDGMSRTVAISVR